jgi:hypothetical protein
MKYTILTVGAALALLTACGARPPATGDVSAATDSSSAGPNATSQHDHAVDDHAGHDHEGPITLTATPATGLRPGEPVTLALGLRDAQGAPVVGEDLKRKHEHLMHVMIVDAGLEDYTHIHPVANTDGTFSVTFTPRFDRPYRLWADFTLEGTSAHSPSEADPRHAHDHNHAHEHTHHPGADGHEDHGQSILASIDLPVGTGAVPVVSAGPQLSAAIDGLRFQVSLAAGLQVGEATEARLAVIDAQGRPYSGLEPLMGAFAHVVGFNPGATRMMHVHPDGGDPPSANARGGPLLSFTLEPETAGPQRLFVQVKAEGREVTLPFTVVVAP